MIHCLTETKKTHSQRGIGERPKVKIEVCVLDARRYRVRGVRRRHSERVHLHAMARFSSHDTNINSVYTKFHPGPKAVTKIMGFEGNPV